jgi:hypothetical protein
MFMLFYYSRFKTESGYQTMKYQPQAIHALLGNNSTLAGLYRHGQQLQELSDTVRECLPDTAARLLQACSFDGSRLTLYARSSTQATALRLASSDLLHRLRQERHLAQLSSIHIRISVDRQQGPSDPPPANVLTDSTAALVSELAETVIDPAIRDILRRLSTRHKTLK